MLRSVGLIRREAESCADLGCSSSYSIESRCLSRWLMTGVEQVSLPTAVEQGSVGRKPSGNAAISE